MNITISRLPKKLEDTAKAISVEEFADRFGLTMQIDEYMDGKRRRFRARLSYVEIVDGHILRSPVGIGANPTTAVRDYLTKINGQLLRISIHGETRETFWFKPYTKTIVANSDVLN